MQNNAIRLLYAGIAVILLSAAFFLGYANGEEDDGVAGLSFCPDRYQEGYDAAHNKLLASGIVVSGASKTATVSGKVESIDGDSIKISTTITSNDPLAETPPAERVVTGLAKATVVIRTQKTAEEMAADSKTFGEAMGKPSDVPPTPPSNYKETEGAVSDIVVGTEVLVTSTEGVDLLYAETIESPERIVLIRTER